MYSRTSSVRFCGRDVRSCNAKTAVIIIRFITRVFDLTKIVIVLIVLEAFVDENMCEGRPKVTSTKYWNGENALTYRLCES